MEKEEPLGVVEEKSGGDVDISRLEHSANRWTIADSIER